jgi:hypothetical protein
MLIFIDVRVCELHYLYVQVKMEIYRKGKCNEFGHVSVNDLHIHYDTLGVNHGNFVMFKLTMQESLNSE